MKSYISGGYYVVKAIPRPPDVSEILPDTLITLSNCFTPVMCDIIQLQWDEYENVAPCIAEEAEEFGIQQDQIAELVTWAKKQQNTNYLVYTDVGPPLELLHRFINGAATRVIGIGLHADLLDSFTSQLSNDINKGLGLAEVVSEKHPLASGGVALGYELLGFEATKFHSWLCHNAPPEAYKRFGIRPNRFGLIDGLEEARNANQYLLEAGAEPAIWEPWLLVEYGRRP